MKIVDLSHRLPGPLCGKILNDLGAHVRLKTMNFKTPSSLGFLLSLIPVLFLGMKI